MSNTDTKIGWFSITNAKSNTYEEFLIWQILRKICRVIQVNVLSQEIFYDEINDKYFITDFVILPPGIVVEIDGEHHNNSQIEYDSKRDSFLESMGLSIIRFDNKMVREHLREVIICILKAVGNKLIHPVPKEFYDWIGKNKNLHYQVINKHKKQLRELKEKELNRNKLYEKIGKYKKEDLKLMANDFLKQMFLNIK